MKLALSFVFALFTLTAQAQGFTPNSIVVSRVGNGTSTLSNFKTASLTLREFNPTTKALTNSVLLDSTGANRVVFFGATTAAAQVTRSADGRFLMLAGYDTATQISNATFPFTTSNTNRVTVRVASNGTVNYNTRYVATTAQVTTALSDSGTKVWMSGTTGWLGYDTLGRTTTPYYVSGVGSGRAMNIQKNQIYNLRAFGDIVMYRSSSDLITDPFPGLPSSKNPGATSIASSTNPIAVNLSSNLSGGGFVFFDVDPSVNWNGTGYDVLYVSNISSGLEKYFWSTADSTWKPSNSAFQVPITITNGGSGYTSVPAVTITTSNGFTPATPGTARAIVAGGKVTHIVIINSILTYTAIPTITIAAPTSGTTATATIDALVPTANPIFTRFGALTQITGTLTTGGKPLIYAVTGNGTATDNVLVSFQDNSLPSEAMSVADGNFVLDSITRAGTNFAFRGVAFSPQQFALPVNLVSFTASLVNGYSLLNWKTASETNSKEFVIERSPDGSNFKAISNVASYNRGYGSSYAYTDADVQKGINYYRLKMVDIDGSFKYSKVVVISLDKNSNASLSIFPNPVVNSLTLGHTKAAKNSNIKIVSTTGISLSHINVAEGATQTSIDVSALLPGQYFIQYFSDGKTLSKAFFK